MPQRGRVSIETLMFRESGLMARYPRPVPPADMDAEEAEVWRVIVNSVPHDHFDRFYPVVFVVSLPMLCGQIVTANGLANCIEDYRKRRKDFNHKLYNALLRAQKKGNLSVRGSARSLHLMRYPTFKHNLELMLNGWDKDKEEKWCDW